MSAGKEMGVSRLMPKDIRFYCQLTNILRVPVHDRILKSWLPRTCPTAIRVEFGFAMAAVDWSYLRNV
ncbi:hypothetical protein C8R31_102624 [Nitrosospira sp. Nsp2]|nr:hypothetical protein C8R31_102624 [Nitrosospira sp. Nsp2]